MFVINISAIIAVAMKIRAACGTETIVVRVVLDIGEPLQPASHQVGLLLTVSMLGNKCQIRAQHQRAKCNKSVIASAQVLSVRGADDSIEPGVKRSETPGPSHKENL